MDNIAQNIALRVLKLFNVILMSIPFVYYWQSYIVPKYNAFGSHHETIIVTLIFIIIYMLFSRAYDAMLVSLSRISEMVYSQVLAAFFADCVVYIIGAIYITGIPNPLAYIAMAIGHFAVAVVWSYIAHKLYFSVFKPERSAAIYDKEHGLGTLIGSYGLDKKFDLQFTMSVEECLGDLSMLDELDCLFLSGVHSHERNIILKYCVEHHVKLYMIPRIGDVIMSGAQQMHMFHLPILRVGRYNPNIEYVVAKRVFDFVSSAIVLIIISPIMLITALAIKLTDGGPVFYKQCRLTQDGERFNVLKFRSMRVDAEKDGVARLSTGENDDRITPVGHFIRKCRLTNVSFAFDVNGIKYVYRHPGGTAGNLINRQAELFCQMNAKKLGIDKSVIKMELSGWKLSYYVKDAKNCDFEKYPEQLKTGMEFLHKLHALKSDGTVKVFDDVEEGKKLMGIASATKGNLFKEFAVEVEKVEKLYAYVKKDAARLGYGLVPCHNDTYEPNYLYDDKDEMYLIDWEYAGLNYAANDICCITCRYDWTEEQIDKYFREYLGRELTEDEYRFYWAFHCICAFYWFNWGLYKGSVGDDDGFFFLPAYRNFTKYIDRAIESYEA